MKSGGSSIPENVEGQAGWGSDQSSPVEGVPKAGGWNYMISKVSCNTIPSMILLST